MKIQDSASRLTGTRIRERRLGLGLRQSHLAAQVGISPAYLNLIEHNKRKIGGKLLGDLARSLQVESGDLSTGAEAALIGLLSAAAARYPAKKAELDRVEELVGRFPGWANVLAAQHGRIRELERLVDALSDRLTHDPHLAANLHEVLSTVTAIRSAVSILSGEDTLERDWQARFLRNVAEDSDRLTRSAQGLVSFLEGGQQEGDAHLSPQQEVTEFLQAHQMFFPSLEEGRGRIADVIAAAPALQSDAAAALADRWLNRYLKDAQALPLQAFAADWQASNFDPLAIAARFHTDVAAVLRRAAGLAGAGLGAVAGLVICDGSGTLTTRYEIPGFPIPRFGAACPRWPLFQALTQPSRPIRAQVHTPGDHQQVFTCLATSEPTFPEGLDGPAVHEATMLILPAPADPAPRQKPLLVGPGCRVCPRAACPARREMSLLALENNDGLSQ
ncbi:MAG TPA: helix-turn-helix domain-containing protein [Aliiroseovarius sp.]|nr:helix-turn-helix domain-containing protein [Aliiroseovarius sp.]